MSARPDTWMPFYFADYLADTTHLADAEQHGAYMLLLHTCWKRGGVLPDDDSQWQSIARLKPQRWKVLKATLRKFFQQSPDGTWTQKRVAEELARARKLTAERSIAGRKGAVAAWQGNGKHDGKAEANGMANERQGHGPSQLPLQNKEELKSLTSVVKGALRARKGDRVDYSRPENRQVFARQKIGPAIGWEIMMAAEDPKNPNHAIAAGLAEAEARKQGVMWKRP